MSLSKVLGLALALAVPSCNLYAVQGELNIQSSDQMYVYVNSTANKYLWTWQNDQVQLLSTWSYSSVGQVLSVCFDAPKRPMRKHLM
jgi:hypothetical protein